MMRTAKNLEAKISWDSRYKFIRQVVSTFVQKILCRIKMPSQPHPEHPPGRLTEVTPETISQNGQFLKRAKVGGGGGGRVWQGGATETLWWYNGTNLGDTVRFVHC
jgi:hypothetical protein